MPTDTIFQVSRISSVKKLNLLLSLEIGGQFTSPSMEEFYLFIQYLSNTALRNPISCCPTTV